MISVFLSHTSVDKPFVRKVAADLQQAGARVWLDEAEIGLGDSIIGKIEDGINQSDFLVVVLSPDAVNSNWVKQELRSLLKDDIDEEQVRVLPLLYRDCEIPPFLRDKLYADFRKGRSYRSALLLVLKRLGLSYAPIKLKKLREAFDPIRGAERLIGSLDSAADRQRFARGLQISIGSATFAQEPRLSIPQVIANQTGISPETQVKYFVSLGKAHSYKFLRALGVRWQRTKGFKRKGFHQRYKKFFEREPCHGMKGHTSLIYSYGELLEWFEVPVEIDFPGSLWGLLDEDLIGEGSES